MSLDSEIEFVAASLRKISPQLPGNMRYRLDNSLDHFDRAFHLLDVDREMASFRAITGEEEAATTLMQSIRYRQYEHAKMFNRHNHQHKAALLACVAAVGMSLGPSLKEFQLIFDYNKPRIDIKIPLSNFGVTGGENYAIQLVEPLGVTHAKGELAESRLFEGALQQVAEQSRFDDIRKMVSDQANARNTLLYASDAALPKSQATLTGLMLRRNRALTMLVLSVMVWQSEVELGLVRQAILSFLRVISKLPEGED